MNVKKWIKENTSSLVGKKVAITGSTGGLGRELCGYLLGLGASLVLMDRNKAKSDALKLELEAKHPDAVIEQITLDLESIENVEDACEKLIELGADVLIHNAGAYDIPRHKCSTGFDNVFQINFISPYYMMRRLYPYFIEKNGRMVFVSSIAHNYSKIDKDDIDFWERKASSLVYGNAKRHLMFSLYEFLAREMDMRMHISVTHPGIAFTGITNHYPAWLFFIIKYPMKIIFMKPRIACLSILKGVFEKTEYKTWIGPAIFNVWGRPKKKKLNTCDEEESAEIFLRAEKIYKNIKHSSSEEKQ